MFLWQTREVQEKRHGREKRVASCGPEPVPKYHKTEKIHYVRKIKGVLKDQKLQKGTNECNPFEAVVFGRHCFCGKKGMGGTLWIVGVKGKVNKMGKLWPCDNTSTDGNSPEETTTVQKKTIAQHSKLTNIFASIWGNERPSCIRISPFGNHPSNDSTTRDVYPMDAKTWGWKFNEEQDNYTVTKYLPINTD